MLYEYLITFIKFISGLMTEKRIIALSFFILAFYLLWVIFALVFSFQKRFNTKCTKMYNLIRRQPKITIHDTKLNNYANKISLGFARGFKNYKNASSGKPSNFISRADALEVEITGGILNQGKSLMKFFITLATVVVFIFNLSLHIGSNVIVGSALVECLALPLILFVLLKLFYYLYTVLKQGLYKSDTVLLYDLLELMDDTFGDRSVSSKFDENSTQSVLPADSGVAETLESSEPSEAPAEIVKDLQKEEQTAVDVEPEEEEEVELEDNAEGTDNVEDSLEIENAPEIETEDTANEQPNLTDDLELESETDELGEVEHDEPEEQEDETDDIEAGELIEEITSNEDLDDMDEDDVGMGKRELKSNGDINLAFENLSKYEIKPEDLDKPDSRVAGELNYEEEARAAREQEENYLSQHREFMEQGEASEQEEPSETEPLDEDLEDDLNEDLESTEESELVEESKEEEPSDEPEQENVEETDSEIEEGSNEIPNSARRVSKEEMLDRYDFFKKKNIDVEKLNGEIPSVQNSLPYINVDSHYVIKDDDTNELNTSEKIEEAKRQRLEQEEAEKQRQQVELADTAKKQDTARQRELERLLGKRISALDEVDEQETEGEQVEQEAKAEPESSGEQEGSQPQQPAATQPQQDEPATPVKESQVEPSAKEQAESTKIEKRVRPRVSAEGTRAKGFEIEYTNTDSRATHQASKKLTRSKLASGGVEIELNEPKHNVKREPVEVKQLKTSDDASSVVSAIKESTSFSDKDYPSNEEKVNKNIVKDGVHSEVQGDIMLISNDNEKIERRVRHAEKQQNRQTDSDILIVNVDSGAKPSVKESSAIGSNAESRAESKKESPKGNAEPRAESKKVETTEHKNKKVEQKKVSERPKKANKVVEGSELEEKRTRGRPKKIIFDENMQIQTDKEFDIALSRAEKLMKKSEEGLSPSQSKRIEKELKTLIDAMNKYKEGK